MCVTYFLILWTHATKIKYIMMGPILKLSDKFVTDNWNAPPFLIFENESALSQDLCGLIKVTYRKPVTFSQVLLVLKADIAFHIIQCIGLLWLKIHHVLPLISSFFLEQYVDLKVTKPSQWELVPKPNISCLVPRLPYVFEYIEVMIKYLFTKWFL